MPENHDHQSGAEPSTERLHTGSDQRSSEPERDVERTTRIPPVPAADEGTQRIQPTAEPESDAERTAQIAALPTDFSNFPIGETQAIPQVAGGWSAAVPPQSPAQRKKRGLIRAGIAAGAAVGVLALLYVGDLALTSGTVPRGTVVAGVAIGGMEPAAAESALKAELGPGLDQPVQLQVADRSTTINPADAGLQMDWSATVAEAGEQPLNPFTRIASLFSTREVAPVSHGDRDQLVQALEQTRPQLDREPAEGTIRFEGAEPVAVEPVTGQFIDVQRATDEVLTHWAEDGPVQVPFTEKPVSTTADGVQRALREIAQPAVKSPVTVRGEGKNATLAPEAIAAALRFEPGVEGGLKANIDLPSVIGAVEPQLADTIKPGKDAEIVLEGGRPVVKPSTDGIGVNWDKSFERLMDVLRAPQNRSVQAVYEHQPAKFTTEQADKMGIKEVVGEFTTGGFEPASGVNIRRTAEQVNGAIIKPGETFSLNGHTGPRGTAQGYVESGIIQDGRPGRAVGGGISQFATTLYNASYFAGMQDVEHKAHSYYISRYPAGREATVFQSPSGASIIDVKFKNVSKSGILITTTWTPSSITVKLWGTKQFEVSSQTGERTNPTQPHEKVVPPGEPCSPSKGSPGFTVTDTRTIRDITTGQTRNETQRTRYEPQPIIHCGAPPA
ncbi:Vancomycin resistance protein YoaR, contains peptidoglycan-binding and VanW domains [Saccharopolyspora antimicrobica]|uniref:Vancomycin resistance protein YoaR n=1 Tax=Saccharopolyspora antimicrobica TaxID=455193 RepID=A0A1I4XF45_9PSEU|nr:VanW family protein [Saccharopolyspora antimicrobica]RKT84484.1 vancomycin resistance protein YoaR [Saccharopolyspora antimicrobica]SFN24538.1 Vancomycin resistance protein YoaR, contains peptidoglycan-binding and VanW domains [Saccharopolyspora antimicrobica]